MIFKKQNQIIIKFGNAMNTSCESLLIFRFGRTKLDAEIYIYLRLFLSL